MDTIHVKDVLILWMIRGREAGGGGGGGGGGNKRERAEYNNQKIISKLRKCQCLSVCLFVHQRKRERMVATED